MFCQSNRNWYLIPIYVLMSVSVVYFGNVNVCFTVRKRPATIIPPGVASSLATNQNYSNSQQQKRTVAAHSSAVALAKIAFLWNTASLGSSPNSLIFCSSTVAIQLACKPPHSRPRAVVGRVGQWPPQTTIKWYLLPRSMKSQWTQRHFHEPWSETIERRRR